MVQASVLQRYLAGKCEVIWAELEAGVDRFGEPIPLEDAWAVAQETMNRVRQNLERLVAGLTEWGYDFTKNRDGSPCVWKTGPLFHPPANTTDLIGRAEIMTSRLPLSLCTFWETVGGVDLTGHFSDRRWPWCAPLQVFPLEEFWREVENLEKDFAALVPGHQEHVVWSIDSSGDSLTIALPTKNHIDFAIEELPNQPTFVSYLRTAFRWGGFPGFENFPNYPTPPEILALRKDLLPI
jgi:hypothetical protein